MKFLLNEKIQIFSVMFEEKEDGSFLERESNLGFFMLILGLIKLKIKAF